MGKYLDKYFEKDIVNDKIMFNRSLIDSILLNIFYQRLKMFFIEMY